MRAIRNALIAFVVVAAGVAGGAYFVLRNGLAADARPGPIETAVARRLVRLSIPRTSRQLSNPRRSDLDAWRQGAKHFAEHCAVCHGSDGRGATEFGPRMYPPVPSLASADIQAFTDGELFAIIQHGVRWTGMPAFASTHSADETWQLVSFIRRLPSLPTADQHHQDRESRDHVDTREPIAAIAIDGTSFSPSELTVHVGDSVVWTNKDPFPHNVTSRLGGFSSGDLDPEARWRFRARKAGRFPYVCTLHPGMKGTLVVEP